MILAVPGTIDNNTREINCPEMSSTWAYTWLFSKGLKTTAITSINTKDDSDKWKTAPSLGFKILIDVKSPQQTAKCELSVRP
jgi:hypothetical protein